MDAPIYRLDRHSLPTPHSFAIGPQVSLEITRGRVQQRIRHVKSRVFLIGSATDCDLVLGDLQFPEAYAYLFVTGSEVTIRRLGAGPELAVCGERIESADLFHGDRVAFGPFEFQVRIDEPSGGRRQLRRFAAEPGFPSADDDGPDCGDDDEVSLLLSDIRRALTEDEDF
jgi:Inner membrane component of T3SS, cytoplasmic domain